MTSYAEVAKRIKNTSGNDTSKKIKKAQIIQKSLVGLTFFLTSKYV